MATLLWFWRLRIVFYMREFCSYILTCNHSTNIYYLLGARHCRMHWIYNGEQNKKKNKKKKQKNNGEQNSHDLYVHGTCSWSKRTLKLKHEGCLRISQTERKQRVKQGEETAWGRPWAKKALEISKNWKKANVIKWNDCLGKSGTRMERARLSKVLHALWNRLGFILRWWEGNTEFPPELWDNKISVLNVSLWLVYGDWGC